MCLCVYVYDVYVYDVYVYDVYVYYVYVYDVYVYFRWKSKIMRRLVDTKKIR